MVVPCLTTFDEMHPASGVPTLIVLDTEYDKEETKYSKAKQKTASQGHSSTGCGKEARLESYKPAGLLLLGLKISPME